MSASILGGSGSGKGIYSWSLIRDSEGYRDYEVVHRVRTTSVNDGPATVMKTPGLPRIGTYWIFGNDFDGWAYCRPDMKVSIHQEKKGDPNKDWQVRQIFSNRPLTRCQDQTIENPLLEPPKVSGGFAKYTEEVTEGYSTLGVAADDGDPPGSGRDVPLQSSSFEPLGVTRPTGRPTVRIELNTGFLGINTFSSLIDTVNDRNLWGLVKRKIRLVNVTWEQKLYGVCSFYYTRIFDFEVDFNTVDREVYDYGSMCLRGSWSTTGDPPVIDTENPVWNDGGGVATDASHFIPFTLPSGARSGVYLNGSGQPVFVKANRVKIDIIHHKEANFLTLDPRIGKAIPVI